jgi:hypothetical protein
MTPFSLLRMSSGPIRSRLLRDLVLLVVFTVGLLVAINVLLINSIKQDLAGSRIDAATLQVRDEVRSLLLPVEQQLLIIRDGLAGAGLTPGGPVPFDAVTAWDLAGRPAEGLVRFHSLGAQWWGGFRPLTDDQSGGWAGVVLPVSETLTILQSRWHIVASTALGILLASLGMTMLVVRKYNRQLRDMPKLSIDRRHAQDDLRELIESGEGTHLEFKSTTRSASCSSFATARPTSSCRSAAP